MAWVARNSVLAVWLAVAVNALSACSNTCEPGDCEPCVGETCELTCVDPDDEDVYYTCPWQCLDGATCDFACRGPQCRLECTDSTCTCDSCDARCTDGADCTVEAFYSSVHCDASTCELQCDTRTPSSCREACKNGSTCTLTCGVYSGGVIPEVDGQSLCAMSCDATSSCHMACAAFARCSLCCGGSADCTLDCPEGGTTCADGVLVCGETTCEEAASTCPVYSDEWTY